MDFVDFIIPHFGRTVMLEQTVQSLLQLQGQEQISRIIVVTKNEQPLPPFNSPKVQVYYLPKAQSISEQRNFGVKQGNASWLAFIDADIHLASNWLLVLLELLNQKKDLVLVSAMQSAPAQAAQTVLLRTTLSNTVLDASVAFLPGRNLLLSRDIHNLVGGFPEHLQTCEDYYYTDKIAKLGKLFYTSRSQYIHLGEDTNLRTTFFKEIWRSKSNLQALKGRKVPLREWPSIALPFWLLFAWGGVLLGFVNNKLLLPSLLLLLTPGLIYATRLLKYRKAPLNPFFIYLFYQVYFSARTLGTLSGLPSLFKRSQ